MEQSASRTASSRHRTGGISTATENVFVYVRHRRLVTFVFERLINIRLLLLLLLISWLTAIVRSFKCTFFLRTQFTSLHGAQIHTSMRHINWRDCIHYVKDTALLQWISEYAVRAYTTADSAVLYLIHAHIASTTPSFALWRTPAVEYCENCTSASWVWFNLK